jgi:2,5-diamino-6-(ribosylamino)-4(3H)-pyrimidinone 5'-phosphate reductase
MRPHIICHMLASVDGKIDGASLRAVAPDGEYEATGAKLGGDGWICGRVTMQQHFAEEGTFRSKNGDVAGPQPAFVARRAESYAIAVDTHGKLLWNRGEIEGDHLISIVSEQAPEDYLKYLRENGISYIVAGTAAIDLPQAMSVLKDAFGIKTLLLEGGGNINGAFLDAGLVDELSLLLVPGIDGRNDVPAVFDGLQGADRVAVPLKLKSVEQRPGGLLWLRYEVINAG